MGTHSMIERAARALATANGVSALNLDREWVNYVDDAREVIAAIREPSEGMVSDGAFQVFKGERITEEDIAAARRVWCGMTSRLLKDTT